jgi:hypothetical protein
MPPRDRPARAADALAQRATSEFARLVSICRDIGRLYEPHLVFIGGIAVYLHTINAPALAALAEATQDADLYISISGFSDLREIEDVTANPRLSKHEFRKGGFSFDVYTERHAALSIPYAEVAAHAVDYDGVRAACVEHLLVLKLAAACERHGSEHGRKDMKDIIRLLLFADARGFTPRRAAAFMQDRQFAMLETIRRGSEFLGLALGNAKEAKAMRVRFERSLAALCAATQGN